MGGEAESNHAQKSSLSKGAALNDGNCEGNKESRHEDTDSDDDQPTRKKV